MSNFLEMAKQDIFGNVPSECARTEALVAIAEQLKAMNLINSGHGLKVQSTDGIVTVPNRMELTDEVASILGLSDEK